MNTETELEKLAEKAYPLDDPRKNMLHDNLGQYSRREAFIAGYKAKEVEFEHEATEHPIFLGHDEWSEKCGLSKAEWELEKVVDKIRVVGTLESIGILRDLLTKEIVDEGDYNELLILKKEVEQQGKEQPIESEDNIWCDVRDIFINDSEALQNLPKQFTIKRKP